MRSPAAWLGALALLSGCGDPDGASPRPGSAGYAGALGAGSAGGAGGAGGVSGGGFPGAGGDPAGGGFPAGGATGQTGGFTGAGTGGFSSGGFTGAGTGGFTGGSGGATATGSGCTLTFTYTNLDNGGRYAPDNVNATWVTNSQGQFVRTLEEDGKRRQSHLTAWELSSGGNTVDAVTGATDSTFRTHHVSWNCLDVNRVPVPPGAYTMNVEFATDNNAGPSGPPHLQVPFQVGAPETLDPPDSGYFEGLQLTIQ